MMHVSQILLVFSYFIKSIKTYHLIHVANDLSSLQTVAEVNVDVKMT